MDRARLCEQIPPIFSSQVGGPSDLRLSASSSFSAHFQTPFERFSFWERVAMAASPAITAALLVNRYSDDAEAHFYLTPTCRALAASNFYAPYRLPPGGIDLKFFEAPNFGVHLVSTVTPRRPHCSLHGHRWVD